MTKRRGVQALRPESPSSIRCDPAKCSTRHGENGDFGDLINLASNGFGMSVPERDLPTNRHPAGPDFLRCECTQAFSTTRRFWLGMKKGKSEFTNRRGESKQNPTEAEQEFLDKFPLEVLEAVLNILRARSTGKQPRLDG